MAVTATPIYPQTIKNSVITIVNADASALKTVFSGGAQGSTIDSWLISSTDTSDRDIQIYFTISATDYLITTLKIPLNSGNTNAIVPVNILAHVQLPGLALDPAGNPILHIASGTTLKIASTTTVTAAKTITSIIQGGDF